MKKSSVKMPQRLDYNERLEDIVHWNKQHKQLLKESKFAGCYYCCNIFPANEIHEWVRSFRKIGEELDCALCPKCGVDSILPDSKVDLSLPLLIELEKYWFGTNGPIYKMINGRPVDIIDESGSYDPKEFEIWKAAILEEYAEK
jgi:hypothetical protein